MPYTFRDAARMVAELRPEEPVYCIRTHVLADTARRFLNGFPGTTMYAVKCNDDPRMLQGLWDGGLRHFDTASLPEIELVRGLFGDAATCHYMHPIKSREAIRAAYFDHGVRSFVVDHPDELAKMAEIVGDLSETIVIVRMEAARHQAVCDLGGKFGADFDTAVRLLRDARALGARLGVTWHVGSQCLSPQAYSMAIALAGEAIEAAGVTVEVIDVGGGFPIDYVGAAAPKLEVFFEEIRTALARLDLDPSVTVYCEPGRALVGPALSIIAKVELRRGDALYLNDGLYGSLSDLRFEGIDFPTRVIRPDGEASTGLAEFRFFGPTCDSTDAMPGPYWLPADVREGDWIEFGQAGAYSTALRTRFNGMFSDSFAYIEDEPFVPSLAMRPKSAAIRFAA